MDESFRLRAGFRNIALIGLLSTPPFVALCARTVIRDAQGWGRVALLVLLGVYAVYMVASCVFLLISCQRHRLVVRQGAVFSQSLCGSKEVVLSEVDEAAWRLTLGGKLVLHAGAQRLAIVFANYSEDEKRRLVKHLHAAIDPDVQTGWNLFAYKVTSGEPKGTVEQPPARRTVPRRGEALVTRRNWDRILLVAIPSSLLAGWVGWWLVHDWRFFVIAPAFVLLPSVPMRLSTPAEGIISRKVFASATPSDNSLNRFMLVSLATLSAGALVGGLAPRTPPWAVVQFLIMTSFFGCLWIELRYESRNRIRRDQEAADRAALLRESRASGALEGAEGI